MTSSLRIIVTGLIAQHPRLGGVTWDYIQYVLGLARLGHDVYYLEDTGEWPYTLDGGPSGQDWIATDCTPNTTYLAQVMSQFGLGDKWAYRFPLNSQWFGLSDINRKTVIETADLLINISGTLEDPQHYRHIPRLAYIDSDPVFTQVKWLRDLRGFRALIDTHDVHFSFGECFSDSVPTTPYTWQPTRQPIVLSEWNHSIPQREVFTTVMNWTSYKPLRHQGHIYGQKDLEFKRFLELPGKVSPTKLEVALSKTEHPNWQLDDGSLPPNVRQWVKSHAQTTVRELLSHTGWKVVEAGKVGRDLDSYRNYIQSSKAEWSVAKHGYVQGQPGWFSCRSACYLAAGKPVVVQETGFSSVLPIGEGILPFTTVEEAVLAINELEGHYRRHAKAARALAEEYFDSGKVLSKFIDTAMTRQGTDNAHEALA